MNRRIMPILAWLVATLLAMPGLDKPATSEHTERASAVKAGMVLNFIRYTEWPDGTFEDEKQGIMVVVVGDGAVGDNLEKIITGQQAHGRNLEVRRLRYPETNADEKQTRKALEEFDRGLQGAHVVFISESEQARLPDHQARIGTRDILTVGDMANFAEHGGMLGLAIRRDRVTFDANKEVIEKTQLKISSKLLRLARIVETKR